MYEDLYRTKLTDAETAVSQIASGSRVALGMAMSQPPALLQALADRASAGKVDDIKLYYYHSEDALQRTLLRYELMGRIKPFCLFLAAAERELIKQGEQDGGRKVVFSCQIILARPFGSSRSTFPSRPFW